MKYKNPSDVSRKTYIKRPTLSFSIENKSEIKRAFKDIPISRPI